MVRGQNAISWRWRSHYSDFSLFCVNPDFSDPYIRCPCFFSNYGKKSEGSRGAVSREWQPLMLSGRKDGFHLENNVSFFCDRVEKEGGIWDIWCVGAQGKVPISLSSKVIPSALKWGASEHTFRYFPTRFVTKGMRGLMGDQILIDAYLVTSKQRDSLGRSRC